MYVLVLGLDVLGNPFGLIRGLSEGVEAFFYEPYQVKMQLISEDILTHHISRQCMNLCLFLLNCCPSVFREPSRVLRSL